MRVGGFLVKVLFFFCFLVFFGVLLSSPVYGSSFSVERGVFDDSVDDNLDFAFVDVVLTNSGSSSSDFVFSFGDGFFSSFWNVSSSFPGVFYEGVSVGSGESKTVRVNVRPAEDTVLREGIAYKVPLVVTSSSDVSEEFTFFVRLSKDPVGFYFDNSDFVVVPVPVESSASSFPVSVNLRSKVSADLDEVEVFVSGEGFNFSKSVSVSSRGFEVVRFDVPLSSFSLGENFLRFDFVVDGKSLSPFFKGFDFGGVGFDVVEGGPESFLLKTVNRVSFNNFGDSVESVFYEVPVSSNVFVDFFSFQSSGFVIVERGGEEFKRWEFDVASGEVVEIVFGSDYRLFIYVGVVLVCVVGFYFFFRSSLFVGKSVTVVSSGKSSCRIKVLVSVKNRSGRSLSNVSVIDRVPGFVSFDKRVSGGFVKPSSVSVTKLGTVLRWKVSSIDAHEERFFCYFVSSSDVSVLGSVRFPGCKVIFYDSSKSKFVSKSRGVSVSLV